MKSIKPLLEKEYIHWYGIHSDDVIADAVLTDCVEFDLDDMATVQILPFRSGKLSICNNSGKSEVVGYESFVKQCKKPSSFLNGRRTCDLILATCDGQSSVLLIEITSAKGSIDNLEKPIYKSGTSIVEFQYGKFQKGEVQLFQSLRDLLCVPKIAAALNEYSKRTCLLAYSVIKPKVQKQFGFSLTPYSRYLEIESSITEDNGAQVYCPNIESLGFEFRRISHNYCYCL